MDGSKSNVNIDIGKKGESTLQLQSFKVHLSGQLKPSQVWQEMHVAQELKKIQKV